MNEDRYSSGPFCRIEFTFNIKEGLRTFGNPRAEDRGTMVYTIPSLGGMQDTAYMPSRFFQSNTESK